METHYPDMQEMHGQLARERVLADLKTLAGDAEALLRATAGDASDKAKETRERLAAAVEKARTTCAELQAKGVESARRAMKSTDETIRTHPYESIGIAFLAGLVVGVLVRRK
jgi:ElaB/YqjD/DUF883 family membrane-anchored ribosome-binding protein